MTIILPKDFVTAVAAGGVRLKTNVLTEDGLTALDNCLRGRRTGTPQAGSLCARLHEIADEQLTAAL